MEVANGLIEAVNEDLGWKDVNVNSSKREKFDFLRTLVEAME